MYKEAKSDLFGYMRNQQASHYLRLSSFGLEKDIQHCLTADTAPVVPIYKEGKLIRY
jgi:2-phosphosulfolactate phosphatase